MTVPMVSLDELADVVSGGTPKRSEPSYFGGDIPWVKIRDMLQGIVASTEESITNAGLKGSSAKLLPAGTLLLSIFATIGRTAVLGVDAATNQAIAGLMIRDSSKIDRNYLRRYLEFASEILANQGRGVAQANINLSILRSHLVPLPPLKEQRRIAAVLDAADALRMKRRQALVKLDSLTQAIFFDMFGDARVKTEGDAGMSIATVSLGEFMPAKKSTIDPRKSPDTEFELFSIPAYDTGTPEIVSGREIGSNKQVLEKNDVLLSRIVPHIRRAWIVEPSSDRPTIGSSEWIIFRNDRFDSAYLRHALMSDRFHQAFMQTVAGVGGSLLRARPSYVANIEIPLPPIEEQQRFGRVVDEVETLRMKHRQALAELDSLFASLQQRAFRGEL